MLLFSSVDRLMNKYTVTRRIFQPVLYIFQMYRVWMLNLPSNSREHWNLRINDVLNCPDIKFIKPQPNSGKVSNGMITLHNGIRVGKTSYYGYPMLNMLLKSKGIHEPQEERVFQEVLKTMPDHAVMVELGSYWSFYSMWFQKEVKSPVCYMVEPSDSCIESGKTNMKINSMTGTFIQSFVCNRSYLNEQGERFISMDDLVKEYQIEFIDILHSDIQGYELEMLEGGATLFKEERIGYIFISTHSNELHEKCVQFLRSYNFKIIANADLNDTYSFDGLIVGRAPYYSGIDEIEISLKTKEHAKNRIE
jgi:hypothetical protein